MSNQEELEHRFQSAFTELEEGVDRLLSRCDALVRIAEGQDPMGPRARTARLIARSLKEAEATLAIQTGSARITLEGFTGGRGTGAHVVRRCVNNLMDELQIPMDSQEGKEPESSPALQGTARIIRVTQLLDTLAGLGTTGTLTVRSFSESIVLSILDGDVAHAVSDSTPPGLRLGDILVQQGVIQAGDLEGLVRQVSRKGTLLGEAILDHGGLTEEQLRTALEYQTRELFQRLFGWEDYTYELREGAAEVARVRTRLSLRSLLLQSFLRSDDGDCAA